MLAPLQLPEKFARWNEEHGVPSGRYKFGMKYLLSRSRYERFRGPFVLQPNNTTRTFEYPWAFYATPISAGQRVLEIGGGLSGFQFVLSKQGCQVVNVDPGLEATGVGWLCDPSSMARLNKTFGTSVELRNTVVTKANLERDSFDRAFSISVLEHLPENELRDTMKITFDCLKPGGYFVLTVDLFLDLAPFTSRRENMYGMNVDIHWLTGLAPFRLAEGNPSELYGFPEFEPDRIQSNLFSYLIGHRYPTLTQCLVLQKPAN